MSPSTISTLIVLINHGYWVDAKQPPSPSPHAHAGPLRQWSDLLSEDPPLFRSAERGESNPHANVSVSVTNAETNVSVNVTKTEPSVPAASGVDPAATPRPAPLEGRPVRRPVAPLAAKQAAQLCDKKQNESVAGKSTGPFKWGTEKDITPEERLADGLLGMAIIMQQGPHEPPYGFGPPATARAFTQLLSERLPTQPARQAVSRLSGMITDDEVVVGQVAGAWAADNLPALGTPVPSPTIDPHTAHWNVCRTTKGYACGLWQILHSLAAAMVRDQRTSSEAAKARNLTYEFMRDFYPCPSCRTNFLAQYADCSDRVCDVDAGGPEVLQEWLWSLHNSINAQNHNESGSKPIWPSQAACPDCGDDYSPAVAAFLDDTYLR